MGLASFEQGLGMAESDSLDRAPADLKAMVLPRLDPRLSEGLTGGEIRDCPLRRARATLRDGFRAPHERADAFRPEAELRL